MKRLAVVYLCLLAAAATPPARADIYKGVAADGTLILTNVYRRGQNYERIRRRPPRRRRRLPARASRWRSRPCPGTCPTPPRWPPRPPNTPCRKPCCMR